MEPHIDEERPIATGGTYNTFDISRHDNSKHQVGDNHYLNNHYYSTEGPSSSPQRPQDRLKDHVSHGALHNSAERGPHAPKCFPETRVAVQQEMISWMKHGRRAQQASAPQRILWLSGPAGSGKTAIMGTIADDCCKEGTLAAGFFFSSFAGHSDRSSKRFFITTLVYQLAQHDSIAGYSDEVSAALDRDPLIFKRDLRAQVDALILIPLRNVAGRSTDGTWPQLFLVDGLDECAGDEEPMQGPGGGSKGEVHREILSILIRASNDPAFPFHILVASRPERAIENYFSSLPPGVLKKMFLDSKYSPEADMELYARAMLSQIGMEYGLPENWFFRAGQALGIEDVPRYWAQEASGQFVYVAAVIRYVQRGTGTPYERLDRMLNWRQGHLSEPFSALDALYTGILRTSPDPMLAVKWIRASVVYDEGSWWYVTVLLESSPGEAQYLLGPLSSLIRIVKENGEPEFHLYHKSLSDFLEDPQRSGDLYITGDEINSFQGSRYSAVLKNKGPLVPLPVSRPMNVFMAEFCFYLTDSDSFLSLHNYHHNASDVDWWLGHHHLAQYSDATSGVIRAFSLVHENCRWYACRPSCKVWRKCILRFASANGWWVPTVLETLRDRFKHIPLRSNDQREVCMNELLGPPDLASRRREVRLRRLEQESSEES